MGWDEMGKKRWRDDIYKAIHQDRQTVNYRQIESVTLLTAISISQLLER